MREELSSWKSTDWDRKWSSRLFVKIPESKSNTFAVLTHVIALFTFNGAKADINRRIWRQLHSRFVGVSKVLCGTCFVCLGLCESHWCVTVLHFNQIKLCCDYEELFGITVFMNKHWERPAILEVKTSDVLLRPTDPLILVLPNSPAGGESSHVSVWRARVKAICLMITSWASQMRHPSLWATCHQHLLFWPQMPL